MSLAWLAWFPYLAFAAAVAGVVAGALHLRGHADARSWMRVALYTAFALAAATMFLLIVLFVLVRTDVQYVFSYTSDTVPLRYRIAGAYAGREGSLTLWAMYAAGVAAAVAWWNRRVERLRGQVNPPLAFAGSRAQSPVNGADAAAAQPADAHARQEASAGATATHARQEASAGAAATPADLEAAPASDAVSPAAADRAGVEAAPRNTPPRGARAAAPPPAALERSRAWTELLLAAVAAAFLGAVAFQDLFGATSDFLLRNRPGGNGLNPTLLSPFILIHPPVMFLAYALTAVPLAAVVADQITGAGAWSRIGMLWSRIDWLLYTFAMGLGGIWAYYTLGFGGYWAWDPVEVANLLPWLALTLFLHAQLHHRRHGSYPHLGPFLGVLPFVLTIFSTISTRSGLWVSVHAFTDPTGTFDPDAGSRILAILEREPGLQFHAALFLGVLLGFLALWARRVAIGTGRLGASSRVVAAVLGAAAVVAFLAPNTLLGLALEAGALLTGGRAGFGLLAVTALAIIAPAAPLLIGDEPTRKARLDMRTFNLAAITVLGIGLLVLFLWHIAAANGWSTQTYLERFPLLAVPVMLGLIAFQGHALLRKDALWLAAGTAVVAAMLYTIDVLWALLLLGGVLVGVSVARVLRAARAKVPRPVAWARGALWCAALLNVVFWLNPPTVRLGIEWRPVWPAQLVLGLAAFLGLHLATRLLAGRSRDAAAAHWVVGLLGGFYVAPLVAIASWWVHQRTRRGDAASRGTAHGGQQDASTVQHVADVPRADPARSSDHLASMAGRRAAGGRRPLGEVGRGRAVRLHQVGLYGIHLAVAVALLGYTLTSYLGVAEEHILGPGDRVDVGGAEARLLRVDQVVERGLIERIEPVLAVDGSVTGVGGQDATARGILYWEPQSASFYPLPATARFWHGDVYLAVDAVCVDPGGECDGAGDWIRAYEGGGRLPAGVAITQVEVQAFTLPGIGLVWSALFLWLYFMGLVMLHGPERG